MNDVFREFLNKFVVCYLDNILMYSKTPEEYMRLVLQKIQDVGLYVKLKKYIFHQSKVKFMRYIISNEGLLMDPKKVQAVME